MSGPAQIAVHGRFGSDPVQRTSQAGKPWATATLAVDLGNGDDQDGPPQWELQEVLHLTPGEEFVKTVNQVLDVWEKQQAASPEAPRESLQAYMARVRKLAIKEAAFSDLGN